MLVSVMPSEEMSGDCIQFLEAAMRYIAEKYGANAILYYLYTDAVVIRYLRSR